jgi:hypothetical protein
MAQVGTRRTVVQMQQSENALLMWTRSLRGVFGLIFLIVLLLSMVTACGNEDLVFPGNIPLPTAAPQPTDTPTPEGG